MTRTEILEAARVATVERGQAYGSPESSFGKIATYWSAHLDAEVRPHDVAVMLTLLKLARLSAHPDHLDSWVDVCGYGACGGEIAARSQQDEDDFPD